MERENQETSYTAEQTGEGEYEIYFSGPLNNRNIASLWNSLQDFFRKKQLSHIDCDFKEVTHMDTAGMALLKQMQDLCTDRGVGFVRRNVPENIQKFLEHAEQRSSGVQEEALPAEGIISRLGRWVAARLTDLHGSIEYIGKLIITGFIVLRHPGQFGYGNFFYHLLRVGAEAVFLVSALSALMGLVDVFQGLSTTRNLGSDIYIADMVALSVTGQMSPLLTAIIVAGRSGAAFAAEIGSMKIRQELDVLSVMNLDIIGFLILPRILAITIATPILTIISDAAGIIGGFLTSRVVIGLPFEAFFIEVREVLNFMNIVTGLIKGTAFGLLIGMTGCYCGLQAQNTTDSIGIQTTSAVVSSILLIVLANSVFAFLFNEIGW